LYTESNTHARMKPKEPKFDQKKEVRAIARERIGAVKPSHAILPKTSRKKPKHKRPLEEQAE
jgi:hypothetical protein